MSSIQIPTVCRFCSRASERSGEDPAGSAGTYEQYLIMEMPLPWPAHVWQDRELLSPALVDQLTLYNSQGTLRPLLIAPDPAYSTPGLIRIFHFRRPDMPFATFTKRDYLIPASKLTGLVEALITKPQQLLSFERYRQESGSLRELFTCTHGRVDVACGKFGFPIYRHLRQRYGDSGSMRVWRSSHFGGHEFAPTLLDFPYGHYWGHVKPGMLDALIKRNRPFSEVARYYRGWGGLGYFEQLAERDILRREGWKWIDYRKQGSLLSLYEAGTNQRIEPSEGTFTRYHQVTRGEPYLVGKVELRIDYSSADGSVHGVYEAMIERSGEALKQWHSADSALSLFHTYRVTSLVRVEDSRPTQNVAVVA